MTENFTWKSGLTAVFSARPDSSPISATSSSSGSLLAFKKKYYFQFRLICLSCEFESTPVYESQIDTEGPVCFEFSVVDPDP
jgi:hypothetical protein